jgi:hypothetical protein
VEVASYRLNDRTFLARFRSSLTEVSGVERYRAPLEMTDGTKWRRTQGPASIRPRCTWSGTSVAAIPVYPPNVLQPFETYCTNLTLVSRFSSPEALHINQRERPLSVKGGTMGEKCLIKFSHTTATSTVTVGFFYTPQSCDMGPTALLPLRRKAC